MVPSCCLRPAAAGSRSELLDHRVLDEVAGALGEVRLTNLLRLLAAEMDQRPRAVRQALADNDLALAEVELLGLHTACAYLGASAVAEASSNLQRATTAARWGARAGLAPALLRLATAISDTQRALASRQPRPPVRA